MRFFGVLLLLLALVLESSLTNLPIVLLVLLCITVFSKDYFVFLIAFIFGLLIDLLSFRNLGLSSIFYIVFIYLVFLYQSKFEITTKNFILVASYFGSFLYLLLCGFISNLILEPLVSTILGLILFIIFNKFLTKKVHD
jgi:cell shape-determining protein MreD